MKTSLILFAAVIAGGLLGGCATPEPSLYQWENYQPEVYEYFKARTGPEEQIAKLEEAAEKIRSKNRIAPPGFHAHLGMLYAQTGKADKAVAEFQAEKAQFPESGRYMDFLLAKYSAK